MHPLLRCHLAAAVFVTACASDPVAPTGTLVVATTTDGTGLDHDGYTITVDQATGREIGPNATLSIPDLSAGGHRVGLDGIAPNCIVSDGVLRDVEVEPGAEIRVEFGVTCLTPSGSLMIVAATRGDSLDDGYLVSVDGGAESALGIRDSIVISGLSTGPHQVRLGGVAPNCAVQGPSSRSTTIPPAATGRVEFVVVCLPPIPATLVVTLSTQVINWPGFSGRFAIAVDGGPERPIPMNGSITIAPLPAGSTRVLLKHPGSCGVGGFFGDHTNPKTVTLVSGRTAFVQFTVLCIG